MFKADVDEFGNVYLDSNPGVRNIEITVSPKGAVITSIDDVIDVSDEDDDVADENLNRLKKYTKGDGAASLTDLAAELAKTSAFNEHGRFLLANSHIDGVTIMG